MTCHSQLPDEGWGRVLYCTMRGKRIVMLHGFIKKSNKTPKGELDVARRRMKEIKDGTVFPVD
jgi:phage-related protein